MKNSTVNKVRSVQKRQFSAHHMLIHIASLELDAAKKDEVGSFNRITTTITFSALALEAFANAVGDRVIKDWSDFENMSPYSKIRFLSEHLNLPYDSSKEPWVSLKDLSKFRNSIAHAKPESLRTETIMSLKKFEQNRLEYPKSKLEKQITLAFASRVVKAFKKIQTLICDQLPPEKIVGLYNDGWSGSAEVFEIPMNNKRKTEKKDRK